MDLLHPLTVLFISIAVSLALVSSIADADETFNFLEHVHATLYPDQDSFTTWEWQPTWALRSPTRSLILLPLSLIPMSKATTLFVIKGLLASVYAVAAGRLVSAAGAGVVGHLFLLVPLCLGSATSFLPSTISTAGVTFALSLVVQKSTKKGQVGGGWTMWLAVGLGCIWGWVFAGLAYLPAILVALATPGARALPATVARAVTVAAALLALEVVLATTEFGRPTLPLLNIVRYNVAGGQSVLYGTEPWHYYLRSLVLSAGPVHAVLLALAPLVTLVRRNRALALLTATAYLWIAFMSAQPHKEERFLHVVGPTVSVAAALTLAEVTSCFPTSLRRATIALGVVATLAFSASRSALLAADYGGPMRLYRRLPEVSIALGSVLCVGSEWHRYQSSFLVPDGIIVHHIDSGFGGLLPGHRSRTDTQRYNADNRAEADRYVAPSHCDYLVDLDPMSAVPRDLVPAEWSVVLAEPFVDRARRSAGGSRLATLRQWLWLPGVEPTGAVSYALFHRRRN
jgi:alpha-1,2-mannosyltransferase